ncbi:MAG TPA: DNA methyltransferase [Chloroflexia bacterium]|nr:DNA methyltransferase [Chloroflexia bacterium]
MSISIARHHNEWLSLVEASGPFLSMPVLMRVFPQGLDVPHEPELSRTLRQAYQEWQDSQQGNKPDIAIHNQWLRWVLQNVLNYPAEALLEGQAMPSNLLVSVPEQGETLRPDYVLQHPNEQKPRLLIQLYPARQKLEKPLQGHLWVASPAERMMQLLRRSDVRLGLLTNGEHWMLVHALPANRDEPVSYISWYSQAWLEEPLTLRAFRSLLQAYRFFGVDEKNTPESLFVESSSNQQEVTDQLGYQVRRAVETLVQAFDRLQRDGGSQQLLLQDVTALEFYEAALTVMMRLVFLMSAEERGMLPLGENQLYDRHYAVSTVGSQLREMADRHSEQILETRCDAWSRLLAAFRMVYGGVNNADLPLPAYGGDLFNPDRFPFLEGRASGSSWQDATAVPVRPLAINNRIVLHMLDALQWLEVRVEGSGVERRKLSFRALDIEQIGHIYEGMLDHTALRAKGAVLGLKGSKYNEPEVELAELERLVAKGEKSLLDFLKEESGRSDNALKKDLAWKPDFEQLGKLRVACGNDEKLLARLLPFAGLIRLDSFDNYLVIPPGAVYVTQGSDRRSTGTHYTPRSLTEPIVQHTLDPLVYLGPAEGWPEEKWQLRPAEEILGLKVCDMAMGSGAFLVQACRYLSEKLVQAWEPAESGASRQAALSPDGAAAEFSLDILPADSDERLALARRLVAERCLYGVDKNPMAVEMAKLSLWLVTLDKNRPFSFLNHALRSGDSLLGANLRQLREMSLKERALVNSGRDMPWIEPLVNKALGRALGLRQSIKRLPVNAGSRVNEEKKRLQKQAEEEMALLRLGADLLVAETLAGLNRERLAQDALFLEYTVLATAYEEAHHQHFSDFGRQESRLAFLKLRSRVDDLLKGRTPFHWPLEFPEVFYSSDISGFDALLGNPPFMGGQKITGALGTDYRDYLVEYLAHGKRGSADFCAYFFLRASDLTRPEGQAGLLATNTIAQGTTREVGLEQLVAEGWTIPRAVPSRKWPSTAALEVAHLWLRNGNWQSPFVLEDTTVSGITPFLTASGTADGKPFTLAANSGKSFQGSIVLGMGFVLEPEEAQALIAKDPRNKEVLFPYLNGEDLNSRPDQSPSRWVINFFDWPLEKAETYPDCMTIVREKAKPERDRLANGDATARDRAKRWWQFARPTLNLYSTIERMKRVLVAPQVSKYSTFAFVPTNQVISMMLVVLAFDTNQEFSIVQSTFHDVWIREYSSSLETRRRYTPTDCFENFPFPLEEKMAGLEGIGEQYYSHRQEIMLQRQEGLTQTYNRFHNPQDSAPEIVKLRELHIEMDEAVAQAYGWQDLALEHGFHQTKQGLRFTISEAARWEVLGRLLKLNHQRHAEEMAEGLSDKGAKKAKKKAAHQKGGLAPASKSQPKQHGSPAPVPASNSAQGRLFEVEQAGSLWEFAAQQQGQPSALETEASVTVATPPAAEVRAWLGSMVQVRQAGRPEIEEYILISEADSKRGLKEKNGIPALSIHSPLGLRLLDRKAGDTVSYKGPDGKPVAFTVLNVK